jgi:hypothetical protein
MNVRQTPTHPPRARSVRRAQQERFLAHVREGYAVSVAATPRGSRGIPCTAGANAVRPSANGGRAWAEGSDVLEQEVRRRAVEGIEEAVYSGGEQVGTVRRSATACWRS